MCVRVVTTTGLSAQFKPVVSCGSVATLFLPFRGQGSGPSGGAGVEKVCPTDRFLQYLMGGTATKQSEVRRNVQ